MDNALEVSCATFFDQTLLGCEYMRRKREVYDHEVALGFVNKFRCFPVIIQKLQSIFEYNAQDALYFARRIRTQQHDTRSCEAVVAEIIVYSHYIPLMQQGLVKSISRCEDDYDVRIERQGHPDVFLEVFCIMPEFKSDANGIFDVSTHTQTAMASVRRKLLLKIQKQRQMQKARENWAVIELNDMTIAGDFTVPASLSDGYKIKFDLSTGSVVDRGFDWSKSVFDAPETENLHGVVYFSLGWYENRKRIVNGRVHRTRDEAISIP